MLVFQTYACFREFSAALEHNRDKLLIRTQQKRKKRKKEKRKFAIVHRGGGLRGGGADHSKGVNTERRPRECTFPTLFVSYKDNAHAHAREPQAGWIANLAWGIIDTCIYHYFFLFVSFTSLLTCIAKVSQAQWISKAGELASIPNEKHPTPAQFVISRFSKNCPRGHAEYPDPWTLSTLSRSLARSFIHSVPNDEMNR